MVPHSGYQEAIRKGKFLSLNHYINESVVGHTTLSSDDKGDVSYLKPLEFQPSLVTGTAFERIKTVRLSTCLTSVVDYDSFKREPLRINAATGGTTSVTTDDEGCFSWNENFKFDFFEGQCWKTGLVDIESASSKIKFRIPIGFSANGHADVYRDLRYFKIPNEQLCSEKPDLSSEIYMSHVTFEKLDYTYEVDEFLNIILVKRGILQINPFLRRESLLDPTGISNDDLPPGQYRVTLAIVDINQTDLNRLDGSKVYALTEKIVNLRAGSLISERFEIKERDIRSMGNTNRLYITIEPVDPVKGPRSHLRTRVFSGSIIPQNNNETSIVEVLNDDEALRKIKVASQQFNLQLRNHLIGQTGKDIYAKNNRLAVFNLDQNEAQHQLRYQISNPLIYKNFTSAREPLPINRLTELFDNPSKVTELGRDLCNYWFGDYGLRPLRGKDHSIFNPVPIHNIRRLILACHSMVAKQFSSIFDTQLLTFVRNPKFKSIESAQFRDIGVGQNFSQNRSVSNTVAKNISWDIGAGLKMPDIPGLNLLSANTGMRFSVMRAWSNAESQNMFEAISSGVTFNSEIVRLRIESPKLERCLAIRLNMGLFMPENILILGERPSMWFSSLHPKLSIEEKEHYALSGIMLCEGESHAKPGEFVETYAIFNQKLPMGASLLDPYSNNTRPFYTSIRGEHDYMKFITFITAKLKIPPGFEGDYSRSGFRENDLINLFKLGFATHPGVTQAIPQITTK
jgi:hypothetical protein